MRSLILTLVGPDRKGLVSGLAEQVAAAGGSWLESRMARMAGQFAGIVRVSLPEGGVETLHRTLARLEAEGFRVALLPGGVEDASAEGTFALELIGQDRPGIVRDISQALARRSVNIEELTTDVISGSFSGEALFRATARLRAPARVALEDIREELERLGNEMMVDIRVTTPVAA
jgi:glycine cleavage system regulatory protein